jgi:hypothetical protein
LSSRFLPLREIDSLRSKPILVIQRDFSKDGRKFSPRAARFEKTEFDKLPDEKAKTKAIPENDAALGNPRQRGFSFDHRSRRWANHSRRTKQQSHHCIPNACAWSERSSQIALHKQAPDSLAADRACDSIQINSWEEIKLKKESADLIERFAGLIAGTIEMAEKVRDGKLSKPFAKDQVQAFTRDISSGLREITDAMNRGKISRVTGLALAAQTHEAIAAIEKAQFGG